jgi:hypothetical protein
MSTPPSPAHRVRNLSIRVGLWASTFAFFFLESYALQDQLAIGHASMSFILGTALLSAGLCIALFALVAAIGLAASVFFSEQPPRRSEELSGSIGPINHGRNPRIHARIKPDAVRRPASVSKRQRHFRRLGS